MRIFTTTPFDRDHSLLPADIQKRFEEKLKFFVVNPFHPSLRSKKMEDPRDIWEASITMQYRFTFMRNGDTAYLRRIGTHDILRKY